MTITITGAKQAPMWETTQRVVREATGQSGKLTRIARTDKVCDYRATGEYELTFIPETGDEIPVKLSVTP